MINNLKSQIYDKVEQMYLNKEWVEKTKARILKQLWLDVPVELIKEIITEIKQGMRTTNDTDNIISSIDTKKLEKKDWWLKKLVNDMWDERLFDYIPETDQILLYPRWRKEKPHPILRTTALALTEKYSKDGDNLSGKQVQYEFGLPPKVWIFMKRVLDQYKDSVPFDKVTLSLMGNEKEMQRAADEAAERLTEAKMRRIYNKSLEAKKDSIIRKISLENWRERDFFNTLWIALKTIEPINVDWLVIPKQVNKLVREVAMADMHMGKKWTDGIIVRLWKITRDLVECEESIINITFLWDLWELFVPYAEMHVGQRLWAEDIWTADLMKLIVKTLTEMLMSLYRAGKTVTFNGMWWNHDRFTEHKQFDPNNEPALAIYYWIQTLVENTTIRVNILRNRANAIKSGNVKYIYLHWDELNEKELLRRAVNEMENWYYLIFITADKHHFKSLELADRVLWLQTSALAWAWRYDKKKWLSSLPWVLETWENEDWMIDFTVKRYK